MPQQFYVIRQGASEDELMHYGVPGMKWGVRRKYYNSDGSLNRAGKARQEYKTAKKEYKTANKQLRREARTAFGVNRLQKFNEHKKKVQDLEMKAIDAKAKFKGAKANSKEKAAKAEFKTYAREMSKTGLAGSAADYQSGGRSSRIYDSLSAKKGKAYADKVSKRVQNQAVAGLVGSAVVLAGSIAAQAYLNSRS